MAEHILFLTGKLAEENLRRVLQDMQPTDFTYDIHQIGISVAALMTTEMILRRLHDARGANRIVLPGRCRGDVVALSQRLGLPVERGPQELRDLPSYFGRDARCIDLSRYEAQILSEIVDAPHMPVRAIVERARRHRRDGADIIDLGCLPETDFPHMEAAVQALKAEGFRVSVDSMNTDELRRGGRAGADFLLSLDEKMLWVADEVASIPVLIPSRPEDLESLCRAIESLEKSGRSYIADPILEPIHSGFTDSLLRYHTLRRRFPQTEIMMGVGNLTELTHADSTGINALLLGIVSELRIAYLLTTEVSGHCRCAVREADLARRIMLAARQDSIPPRHIDERLMALHERKPFPYDAQEIRELAEAIRDPSYRIQISEQGLHIFNRDGFHTARDPFELYPALGVEDDGGHAFYLGVELARAQIAWQLGKRYSQDEELDWGCAVQRTEQDLNRFKEPGPTLAAGKKKKNTKKR